MVTFIGDVSWKLSSEPVWSTDAFGLDQCRIAYRGAVTLKSEFEDTLTVAKFAALDGYPRMYFMGHGDDGHPIFPTVELNFVGVRSSLPSPKVVNQRILQTVSTSGTVMGKDEDGNDKEVEGSMEATYYASRTTYRWITDKLPPAEPQYNQVQQAVSPAPISFRINATGTASGTVNYAAFVTLYNSLSVQNVVTDYTREQIVPGKIWACESSIDYMLVGS